MSEFLYLPEGQTVLEIFKSFVWAVVFLAGGFVGMSAWCQDRRNKWGYRIVQAVFRCGFDADGSSKVLETQRSGLSTSQDGIQQVESTQARMMCVAAIFALLIAGLVASSVLVFGSRSSAEAREYRKSPKIAAFEELEDSERASVAADSPQVRETPRQRLERARRESKARTDAFDKRFEKSTNSAAKTDEQQALAQEETPQQRLERVERELNERKERSRKILKDRQEKLRQRNLEKIEDASGSVEPSVSDLEVQTEIARMFDALRNTTPKEKIMTDAEIDEYLRRKRDLTEKQADTK